MVRTLLYTSLLLASAIGSAQTQIALDIRGIGCSGGSGLCNPDRTLSNKSTMNIYTTTKIDFNKMSFEIDPKNLTAEDQVRFLGKDYRNLKPDETVVFLQENDFVFDIDTLIYLDLDVAYRLLKRGSYPVTIEKDKVKVTFTLSYQK